MKLEVYKITNLINGKIYIGITNQGSKVRWCKHCSDSRQGSDFPIHNAIRKYGEDNFQIEVIEVIENEDYDYLKAREVYWVKVYDSYNREKGYNLTLGGDGTFGRFHSAETKEKIRQSKIGRKHSKESRHNMSESHKRLEYNHDEMSSRCKKGNGIRWSNLDNRKNASLNNKNNKAILQIDLEMNIIAEFRSSSEAARCIGKTHQNICKCALGKLPTAYGFIWRYKN